MVTCATDPTGTRAVGRVRWAVAFAAALVLALVAPGAAAAQQTVVTFDDLAPGATVTNQYEASLGVRFLDADPGFLPTVRSAPGRARSGSNVVSIGCPQPCGIEFWDGRTFGRFTTATRAVTLYAGYLAAAPNDAQLTLFARNAAGTVVAQSPPTTVVAGQPFDRMMQAVSPSPLPDIVSFELLASNGAIDTNEDVGFDDLTLGLPPPPDTTAPDTAIVATPPATTTDRTPSFSFASTEGGATFECSVDDGPFQPCSSPLSLPELPAGTHTLAVRARDSAGNADPSPASFTFVIPAELSDLPPPALGRQVNIAPLAGEVLFAVPSPSAGTARAAQKGLTFRPLREARQLPVGAFFDTRKGRIRLQTATVRRGRNQDGVFSGGLFQTLQARSGASKGIAELRLKGSSFRACRSAGHRRRATTSRHSRRRIRRLRGNARGRFRTRGRYSAATVRGTVWEVSDRCDGTATRVRSGRVVVRDFRRRRNVLVRAGKSYLAKARR